MKSRPAAAFMVLAAALAFPAGAGAQPGLAPLTTLLATPTAPTPNPPQRLPNPVALKGDTSCRPGDADCNRCANDVRGQFSNLSMKNWKQGSWTFDANARYAPDDKLAKEALRRGTTFDGYHIQGLVRTNSAEYPYAGTHSAQGPKHGVIFFIGSDGKLRALHESNHYHPSGVAVLGDALFLGEGATDIRWFRVSAAGEDQNGTWPLPEKGPQDPGLSAAGGGLGLAKLRDGTTLLVTSTPGSGFRRTRLPEAREDDARPRYTRFYQLTGNPAAPKAPSIRFLGEYEHPFGPGRCEAGMEKSGALCYPKCPKGYKGVGPVCWERCPSGYKDDGATCRKPVVIKAKASYGRGAGKPMGCSSNEEKDGALCYEKCGSGFNGVGPVCWQKCPSGFRNDGAFCGKPKAYGRGVGRLKKKCESKHGKGHCEKNAGLWYKKCRPGFHNVVCCICSPDCPEGMKDIGVSCQKKNSTRGAGSPLHACGADKEKDGALCYPRCKAGYKGVGPVCWKSCPAGFEDDGATCRKPGALHAKKTHPRGVGEPMNPKQPFAYSENLSVVTECGTGDLYTVHTTGTYALMGTGFWRLSRIENGGDGPRLRHLAFREQPQRERNCHHRSSATVGVDRDGKLEFLCSERTVQTRTFNFLTARP